MKKIIDAYEYGQLTRDRQLVCLLKYADSFIARKHKLRDKDLIQELAIKLWPWLNSEERFEIQLSQGASALFKVDIKFTQTSAENMFRNKLRLERIHNKAESEIRDRMYSDSYRLSAEKERLRDYIDSLDKDSYDFKALSWSLENHWDKLSDIYKGCGLSHKQLIRVISRASQYLNPSQID